MRFFILFFILFGYLNASVSGQVIHLNNNLTYHNLGKKVIYFEDKTTKLNLAQVKALESTGKFNKGKDDILNLGNTKSAFWIKINYINSSNIRNYLVLDVPNIEHIDCYVLSGKKTTYMSSGAIKSSSPGIIAENNFIFTLPVPVGNQTISELWIRLKTNNILMVPIKMATSNDFISGVSIKNNFETIYIGVLLTLFLFNIFLYFSLKDSTYLYYVLYVSSLTIYVVGYLRGYGYLLGDNFRIYINLYPHAFLGLSIIASLLFSKKLLNIKSLSGHLNQTFHVLMGCCIIMCCSSILGYKSISANFAQYTSIITSVVLWISGIVAIKKGHKPAKYYLIAITFIAFTVIAVVLSLAGILKYYDYSFEFVPIGSTIELLLLSLALGDRYKTIIKSEQAVRDENLSLVQTQNQRLEQVVKERTLKLSETIVQLEDSNAVKSKLFSIIAHDLRSPFNSLISIFSLKDMDLLTLDELKMLLNENRKNIDNIHNTLNNLLYWAKNQMEGVKTQPVKFDLKLLIDDLILVYLPLIQKKKIAVNIEPDGVFLVYADENQVQLIIRNLIDNAIKFTPESRSININLSNRDNHIKLCVSNTISDSNKLDIKNIMSPNAFESTYGTGHEKGIGLGLHLCREYIRSNGSELEVNMTGRLVSFCFQLSRVQN